MSFFGRDAGAEAGTLRLHIARAVHRGSSISAITRRFAVSPSTLSCLCARCARPAGRRGRSAPPAPSREGDGPYQRWAGVTGRL
jgi:hypothetical protein